MYGRTSKFRDNVVISQFPLTSLSYPTHPTVPLIPPATTNPILHRHQNPDIPHSTNPHKQHRPSNPPILNPNLNPEKLLFRMELLFVPISPKD